MQEEQEESTRDDDYANNCYVLRVLKNKRRRTTHQKSKEDSLQPGNKLKYKKKKWLVKEFKEKGVVET